MALFSDDRMPDGRMPAVRGHNSRRGGGAGRVGWIVLCVAIAIGLILAVAPAPYVIDKPGPVYNTLGTADHDGEERPLISIPDEKMYPTSGNLDLLTISRVGNPDTRPNWLAVIGAWLTSSEAVVPIDVAYPPNVTTEQREQANEAQMVNSQQDAIAAALTELGYEYPTTLTVVSLPADSPSEGIIEPDDQVVSVNGEAVANVEKLREALNDSGADAEATIGIIRDGVAKDVTVTPVDVGGAVVAGINVGVEYEFPIDVELQLDRVGGPSAGMMFALGIIDKLTPGQIQGGEHVAGTGTIDQSGKVGAIGGIRQKLYGAKDAGAEWFLAPESNCDEVTGHVPDGLTVFSVATLDDSLAALEAIRTGEGVSDLPSCPAA